MDSRQGLIVAKGVEFARRAGGLRQTMRHTKAINMKNAPSSPIGQTFEVQTRGETACRTSLNLASCHGCAFAPAGSHSRRR